MSRVSIERALPAGDRLLLDTSALLAYFSQAEAIYPVVEHILDLLVRPGRNPATVSMVTVMEALVRPLRQQPGDGYTYLLDFLQRFPHLHLGVIDLQVAQEAASLRAAFRLATPDALVAATGVASQVSHLITNDANWATRLPPLAGRIHVCLLSDHLPFP